MGTPPAHSRTSFSIAPDHPAIPGHFPGNPVVPGVVILDMVRRAAEPALPAGLRINRLPRAKFVAPLLPGQQVDIDLQQHGARLEFLVSRNGQLIAQGAFELGQAPAT